MAHVKTLPPEFREFLDDVSVKKLSDIDDALAGLTVKKAVQALRSTKARTGGVSASAIRRTRFGFKSEQKR